MSPVRTLGRTNGFTLVELFIVTLLLAIFLTFASVNWDVFSKKSGETFLEQFSIEVALLREEAVSSYEERVMEFDLSTNRIAIGRFDRDKGFTQVRELLIPESYVLKDIVVNGEKYAQGKASARFFPAGMNDRVILHFETENDQFYSVLLNPLTAKVTGEYTYIDEIALPARNNTP